MRATRATQDCETIEPNTRFGSHQTAFDIKPRVQFLFSIGLVALNGTYSIEWNTVYNHACKAIGHFSAYKYYKIEVNSVLFYQTIFQLEIPDHRFSSCSSWIKSIVSVPGFTGPCPIVRCLLFYTDTCFLQASLKAELCISLLININGTWQQS